MIRLKKKWETARTVVPGPDFPLGSNKSRQGVVYFGTTADAALEALEMLAAHGHEFDVMRVKAFPFNDDVKAFFENHDQVFVIEQNRDAQFRSLLIAELNLSSQQIFPVLNFDGMPITADHILDQILKQPKEPAYVMRDDQTSRP